MLLVSIFFFFKQKTAYEMRISDWSSDVCSSDLLVHAFATVLRFTASSFDATKEEAMVETSGTSQLFPALTRLWLTQSPALGDTMLPAPEADRVRRALSRGVVLAESPRETAPGPRSDRGQVEPRRGSRSGERRVGQEGVRRVRY